MSAPFLTPSYVLRVLAAIMAVGVGALALAAVGPGERAGKSGPAPPPAAASKPLDAFQRLARDFPVADTPYLKAYAPAEATRHLSKYPTEQELSALLREVPELDLEKGAEPSSAEDARLRLGDQVKAVGRQNGSGTDGFITELAKSRVDIAGLPLYLGERSQLDPKQAGDLTILSLAVRTCLDDARQGNPGQWPVPHVFWDSLEQNGEIKKLPRQAELTAPALEQMLQAEHADLRVSLVERLWPTSNKPATIALARRAVFDTHADVRARALAALKGRPVEQYQDVLMGALRYPWPPVAQQAAEAIAALKPSGAVAALVRLLDEPDPDAPFVQRTEGKEVTAVRELVRVNHLRNCLLCHAPSSSERDLVRGVVPVPGEPLPPSFRAYYQSRFGVFVRADITYLRQDFSVMQPVEKSEKWPALQRYDYLVRTRPLTEAERTAWEAKGKTVVSPPSPYRRAVLYALCALTGEYAGPRAADWRRLVPKVESAPGPQR